MLRILSCIFPAIAVFFWSVLTDIDRPTVVVIIMVSACIVLGVAAVIKDGPDSRHKHGF